MIGIRKIEMKNFLKPTKVKIFITTLIVFGGFQSLTDQYFSSEIKMAALAVVPYLVSGIRISIGDTPP